MGFKRVWLAAVAAFVVVIGSATPALAKSEGKSVNLLISTLPLAMSSTLAGGIQFGLAKFMTIAPIGQYYFGSEGSNWGAGGRTDFYLNGKKLTSAVILGLEGRYVSSTTTLGGKANVIWGGLNTGFHWFIAGPMNVLFEVGIAYGKISGNTWLTGLQGFFPNFGVHAGFAF